MTKPIWQPSPENIQHSNLTHYTGYVEKVFQLEFTDYHDLYQWSIDAPAQFWQSIWDYCQIKYSQLYTTIVTNLDKMPGAIWFSGAKLNFAENLLRYRNDKIALIYRDEHRHRSQLTYAELYNAVARLAAALKQDGVQPGDRVAGFLPNIPETVIAMLAATSLGAIWSSCSPDFGIHGALDRFSQIEPKILFSTDGYYYNGNLQDCRDKVKACIENLPNLQRNIIIHDVDEELKIDDLSKTINYEDYIQKQTETEINFYQADFNHPIYIMFSSGTTGKPKCIVHGAGGTLLQHLKELILHTNLTPNDVFFYYTTCGWMMWNWFISGLAVGATLVLFDGSPFYLRRRTLFNLIDETKTTIFGTSAKFISAVEKSRLQPMETNSLQSLQVILSTGSPLVPENYHFIYKHIKKNVRVSSISGGTDIISCFALGNPNLPVYPGELQCRGLGMKVEIYNEQGQPVTGEKGELVCTLPFPSMPLYFWDDADREKFRQAYFAKYPGIWAHGDYAELTPRQTLIIYGRSDAVLNPGGVRIGTAEIYRQVELVPEVKESLAVGQEWKDDIRVILFIILQDGYELTKELSKKIKYTIRENATPRHVPAKIIQVPDLPRTINGKIAEIAVREIIHGREVKNLDALANPGSLEAFKSLPELLSN